MRILGIIAASVLAIVALLALSVGMGLFGLEYDRFFKPRKAEIERTVFENTPSFVHGKAQHITRLRLDYETAETDTQRAALRRVILHEASTIDNSLLPIDIQNFLNTL